MPKLHDLLANLIINRVAFVFGVVVMHNEKKVFQLKGVIT
jgi:hypothetical protein